MSEEYIMNQIIFWENMLQELRKPKQDDLIIEIDEIKRTGSTEELKNLYHKLRDMETHGELTKEQHRKYLKYISTGRMVA